LTIGQCVEVERRKGAWWDGGFAGVPVTGWRDEGVRVVPPTPASGVVSAGGVGCVADIRWFGAVRRRLAPAGWNETGAVDVLGVMEARGRRQVTPVAGATLWGVTAKEKVLKDAPDWSEAVATAVLRVVDSQDKLEAWFEAESKLTPAEVKARDDARAEANARELIREEPW
jgi:hypothetical protein